MAFDDGYDPDKAPACFKRMVKEGVFSLGFFVGTPTAAKYVPLAQEEHIPAVGLLCPQAIDLKSVTLICVKVCEVEHPCGRHCHPIIN